MKTRSANTKIHILIIGSLPPPLGGTAVSLKHLVDGLHADKSIHIQVVDTSGIRGHKLSGLFRFIATLSRIFVFTLRTDVVTLHCATTALPYFGILVLAMARLAGKPFLVRKFAGSDYMAMKTPKCHLAHFVIRHADIYLAQTRCLIRLAKERAVHHVKWYPTSRPMKNCKRQLLKKGNSCRRYIFVSQVRAYKGVRELLEATKKCDNHITVDVYGPWFDDLPKDIFCECSRIQYRGVLDPNTVIDALAQYDALVFPTKQDSEGYPGIIIEAYFAGLPVISTTCGAIPEIVNDKTGILVPPGDVESLYLAMTKLASDEKLFFDLKTNVQTQSTQFDSDVWAKKFVSYCSEVYNEKQQVIL